MYFNIFLLKREGGKGAFWERDTILLHGYIKQ